MKAFLTRFQTDESGATAIEYGLIAALMCIACLTAFSALGTAGTNLIAQTMDIIRAALSG